MFFSCPYILPMVPLLAFMCLRMLSNREPEPQAKSSTLSSFRLGSACGILGVQDHDLGQDGGDLLGRIKFARFFTGTGGKLANQIFIGISECVGIGGKIRNTLGNFADDLAKLFISVRGCSAEFFGIEIYLGEQPLKGAFKRLVFYVAEPFFEGHEQLVVL